MCNLYMRHLDTCGVFCRVQCSLQVVLHTQWDISCPGHELKDDRNVGCTVWIHLRDWSRVTHLSRSSKNPFTPWQRHMDCIFHVAGILLLSGHRERMGAHRVRFSSSLLPWLLNINKATALLSLVFIPFCIRHIRAPLLCLCLTLYSVLFWLLFLGLWIGSSPILRYSLQQFGPRISWGSVIIVSSLSFRNVAFEVAWLLSCEKEARIK